MIVREEFFEVQIGNFKNFNMDAYLGELQALRQEKQALLLDFV